MPRNLRRLAGAVLALALNGALAGCGYLLPMDLGMSAAPVPVEAPAVAGWGQTIVVATSPETSDMDGPYLLDSGDRLRIFV